MTTLIKNLQKLKKMGATAIKQSLEDEGSSYEDIKNMQKICKKVGMPLNLKIGGCEAINDINFCRLISSNNIIAPMVETKYAFKKFIKNLIMLNSYTKNYFKNK